MRPVVPRGLDHLRDIPGGSGRERRLVVLPLIGVVSVDITRTLLAKLRTDALLNTSGRSEVASLTLTPGRTSA